MRTCSRCGLEYSGSGDELFCTCGTRLALPSPDAGTELAELQQVVRGTMTQMAARMNALEQDLLARQRIPVGDPRAGLATLDDGGFRSGFGEFLNTCRFNPGDARLQALTPTATRELSMGAGGAGGFLVPPQFAAMLLSIGPQDAVVRPRATVLPAGTSPDAPITIPADDQGGALGVHSGVQVVWTGEGGLKHETQPALREITLTPREVSAYSTVFPGLAQRGRWK